MFIQHAYKSGQKERFKLKKKHQISVETDLVLHVTAHRGATDCWFNPLQ